MQIERVIHVLDAAHVRTGDLDVFALVVDVEQLTGRPGSQEQTVVADELQRVPLGRVVAGRDGDPAVGAALAHGQLHGRHRAHTQVDGAAAARQQAGEHGLPHHFTRGPGVPPEDDGPRPAVGAEGLGEPRQQCRRERVPDDAAHA